MNVPHPAHSSGFEPRCLIEPLENRRLFSSTVAASVIAAAPAVPSVTAPTVGFHHKTIYAETNQAFTAVIGKITNLPKLPTGYTLKGSIDWGDGSATSAATFVKMSDGEIAVIGSHTYAKAKTEHITITVIKYPPIVIGATSSLPAILVIGKIKSTADVENATNGVTLSETANKSFTADLGSISTNFNTTTMHVLINWGDGTTSGRKLIREPVIDPPTSDSSIILLGRYLVQGTHKYAHTGSYKVHVSVTYFPPFVPGQPTPDFIVLVANFDSVIDVLPPT